MTILILISPLHNSFFIFLWRVFFTTEPTFILLSKQSVLIHASMDLSRRVPFFDTNCECQETSAEALSPPQFFQNHNQYPHPDNEKRVHFTELLRI